MYIACCKGDLSMCKWLFEVGAAADITKMTKNGATPMYIACEKGHLSVCKWLFEVGAAADITKATNYGSTPMSIACYKGHLSVNKWLFGVGAAADIREAANNGMTPMRYACDEGHIVLCQWLVRVGALNQANDDDEVHEDYFGDGHVDQAIVASDVRDNRPALLEWALDAIATNHQYCDTVLRGSIIHINAHQQLSPANRCRL